MNPIKLVNRKTNEIFEESVMGNGALKFAYETLLGRTLWPILFGSKFISFLLGLYYDSRASKKAILSLTKIPGCKSDEAEKRIDEYNSFNDFFTRRLKPDARKLGEHFVSPADGRLMLYLNASSTLPFPLKGATRSLQEIFAFNENEKNNLESSYDIAVVRLAPVDYHRFHFPCECKTKEGTRVIKGKYHSVNPIALLKYPNVYIDNERHITICENEKIGRFYLIDVGAFGVGTIVQTFSNLEHKKGDEKGYFKFGGSTVILVTRAGALKFDEDIVKNSSEGIETVVRCGETIAR